jgi:hypothetical protein
MKLDVLLLISAFTLAFVHPDAAQVAASAVLVLLVTRIERERKNKKRAQQIAEARGRRGN